MADVLSARSMRGIRVRMIVTAVVLSALFGVALYRAFALTVVQHAKMKHLAEAQYMRTVQLPGVRGSIVDRHGSALAVSVEVSSIYANPKEMKGHAEENAQILAAAIGADPYLLTERFRSNRYFVWIQRRVGPDVLKRVRSLHIKGIYFKKEMRRFYPNGRLAGQVIGFVGSDDKGLEGSELQFNQWLTGSRSQVTGLKDALGRAVFVDGLPDLGPASGHTVVLTLDKTIQFEAQKALEEAVTKTEAKGGTLVVMDPKTGEILALANAPGFDPNTPQGSKPRQWRDRAVTDTFEPGSVTKVFTLAATLETRVATVDDHVYCENGRITVDDHIIRDSHAHKWLTVTQCIKKSSNICTFKLAERLGRKRLYDYLRSFGFGQRTGIRLPGERRGRLRPWRRWSRAALANISFGQGFTVTAVQLCAGLSALANGGTLYPPRILRSVRDADGNVTLVTRPRGRRVVAPWVAHTVIDVMRTVVQPGGTGVQAAMEDYPVAGKTGTAQKVDPETGRYSNERWVASFMGVVPADDPALAIVVMVDEPQTEHYGGDVAAPVFKRVAQAALDVLAVPRRPGGSRTKVHKNAASRTKSRSVSLASVVPAAPALPAATPQGPSRHVPDFSGLTMYQVVEAARKAGLTCRLEGSGVAVNQSPPPGSAPADVECRVSFSAPR